MCKKQMIIAAVATMLSISAATAGTITGFEGVTNGVYNIDPAKVSGDVGYRYYDNFKLNQGEIANLIYQGLRDGKVRNIEAFINLVQSGIDINGIVNTVRNGKFHDGHAIFISPNGMTVGASGVLNVGTLSVLTPTQTKFNELKTGYDARDYEVINNISQLRNGSGMNYAGNAPVKIQGTVIARNGVDIRGSQIDISGGIVNGYTGTQTFNDAETAKTLFNTLVNTDGLAAGLNNGSNVIIKSGAGSTAKIAITGKVANLNNDGLTAITNHGNAGLTVNGLVSTNNKLNIYNNNTSSNLTVGDNAQILKNTAGVSITNKGANLNINEGAKINTPGYLEVVNNGQATTSKLTVASKNVVSAGKMDVVNRGKGGMEITGNLGDVDKNLDPKTTPSIRIVNESGKLVFSGKANALNTVSVRNKGTQGMEVSGTIAAGEGVLVHNEAGNALLDGTIRVADGEIAVRNDGTGKLTTGEDSDISATGNIAIKNTAKGGMELNGSISGGEGAEIAINNTAGAAVVNGNIDHIGNMGIINKENGTGLTVGAVINTEGKLKLVNSSGANGLTVTEDAYIHNESGKTYLYNDAGHMTINGTVQNDNGSTYVMSRAASTGITTGANSLIYNELGNLAIKHNGVVAKAGDKGLDLNGKVQNVDGETAINNYNGKMHVGGNVVTSGENLGIINRAGGDDMTVDAVINANSETVNIKNYADADMTVNGEITHNGRLNVLANEGNLILGGKITNNGTDMTYAAARTQYDSKGNPISSGDGIDVKSTFNATSTNGGLILIKNISGANGLKYDGKMTAANGGQAEVYNQVGNMTVTGAINGTPAVVLNTGNKLTVTDAANLQGNVKIVNKGTAPATVADKYKSKFRGN